MLLSVVNTLTRVPDPCEPAGDIRKHKDRFTEGAYDLELLGSGLVSITCTRSNRTVLVFPGSVAWVIPLPKPEPVTLPDPAPLSLPKSKKK